jgi:hypothetical protein
LLAVKRALESEKIEPGGKAMGYNSAHVSLFRPPRRRAARAAIDCFYCLATGGPRRTFDRQWSVFRRAACAATAVRASAL